MTQYTVFLTVTESALTALTALAVETERLAESEGRAAVALADVPSGAVWPDLAPAVRRETVARVRAVPHHAVDHTAGPRPLDCLNSLAVNSSLAEIADRPRTVYLTGDRPLGEAATAPFLAGAEAVRADAGARYPALARLVALLATAAASSVEGAVPDEQDLYDAFDRYTLGGLD